ncbi:hypothetical protein A1Q1_06766 [Trichosporon asahii var. asahii CBS 2479]|uniref:Uncharacterized protein n=1 Tax=Trichosporon asahii var. asahii (strain ATCC 90039 / CBS 2479 / JCM 2466 / KCTC 7840 / NBRC 103889/ NCYC 2677 / UAMH 7654) TaxID=1186058 RepID=J5RDL8_TRIAS|nr:hypothetical protein A1Q1_06766 [Trichosporon asahii var. asahii CBS 2479]EJT52053.1 hypothetical protein A1Q1_06766 [Trichosporon asahii var. asahii CBS 2479]
MDTDKAGAIPNGHCGVNEPNHQNTCFSTPRSTILHDHKRSQSASATDPDPLSQLSTTEPTTPKSKSLPPLLPPAELYSHLRDTTTEVAPHPATLSPLLRSSSFRRRFSTPPHLSPVRSPCRSRPPSPLATKTHSGSSSSGYFDFMPMSGTDTPMLDRDRECQAQGRRGSIGSDALLLTPAEERQFNLSGWNTNSTASTPRTLSQRGSEDQLHKSAAASPEPGSKLSGGDSPSTGTLERRARRRQVVRLDSFGGEGLMRKPSTRHLDGGFPGSEMSQMPAGTKAPPPTPMTE